MIFDEATYDSFGYYPKELTPQSTKFVMAVCNNCAKVRVIRRYSYHDLCLSCSHKGNTSGRGNRGRTHTEETKAKISAAKKGKIVTEDHKANIRESKRGKKNFMFGRFGDMHHNYKGGRKEAFTRYRKTEKGRTNNAKVLAKRRQGLEYTVLMPLATGEVGHHITNKFVLGIPAEVHQLFGGYSRENHRKLILEWLKTHDITKYEMTIKVL